MLENILADQAVGVGFVHKILASPCVSDGDRIQVAECVKVVLSKMQVNQVQGYRRLMEELGLILMSSAGNAPNPAAQHQGQNLGVPMSGMPSLVSPLDATFPAIAGQLPPQHQQSNLMPQQSLFGAMMAQQAAMNSLQQQQQSNNTSPMASPTSATSGQNIYNPAMFNPQMAMFGLMGMNPQMMQANAAYMMQNPAFAALVQQQVQQMATAMAQSNVAAGGNPGMPGNGVNPVNPYGQPIQFAPPPHVSQNAKQDKENPKSE